MANCLPDFTVAPSAPSDDSSQLCILCRSQERSPQAFLCLPCQQQVFQCIGDLPTDANVAVWECPRCTLFNKIDDERCDACGTPKAESHREENVLVNTAMHSKQGTMSLTVRARRHQDQSKAERMFQNIRNHCKKNKTHFVDDQFFPAKRSLGPGSFGHVAHWLRISEIVPSSHEDRKLPWTMFSSPQPSDIQQGALGNCWLVAVLALIAERPRLLDHILLTKTLNKEGVYLVRICHNGLWQPIIVDDCFPCTSHNHLVFSQAKRRQLYIPLIEKACAKIFGSYGNLTSGNMLEGLQLLTGAPCDYIDLQPTHNPLDEDIVWAKLLSACESNLLIGVSTGGTNVSPNEYDSVHIHRNHAFSLLTAHTLKLPPHRFVLVRDPHSHSRYSEDAIKGDVMKQLHAFKSSDRSTGAFWISWNRFLRYFSSITISTYNSDHFELREQGHFNRSATDNVTSYRIHVPQTSTVTISLLYHRRNRATHSYHTQGFVLCDADDSSSSDRLGRRESFLECKRGGFTYWSGSLRAGHYVIIPFSTSFWQSGEKHRDYTVVIHSSAHLGLTIREKSSTFLADCLISATMRMCNHPKQGKEHVFYKTPKRSAMTIFVVENSSSSRYFNTDVDMNIAKNVRHSRHRQLPYGTHDSIPPLHRQIVFITEWADKRGQSSELSYSYSYQHHSNKSDPKPSIDISHRDLHSPRKIVL